MRTTSDFLSSTFKGGDNISRDFGIYLKEKRLEYGISVNRLAIDSGITGRYIRKIESPECNVSNRVKELLTASLNRLNPEAPLTAMIDYFRVRVPTLEFEKVIEELLMIKFEFMGKEDYAFYSYESMYYYGEIKVMTSSDESKGTLIEFSGKACRQFENLLQGQKRSWYEFLIDCFSFKGIIKRIDLAINDRVGILNIAELIKKCENGELVSLFRTAKTISSVENRSDCSLKGNTLYLGSAKSEVFFYIYEKDFEQYIKNNIELDEALVKNRFEIRLKNEHAHKSVIDLITHFDIEKTTFEIINRYVRFVDRNDNVSKQRWKTSRMWNEFIGDGRGELKLTTQPEEVSLTRTLDWIERQVAPSLKAIKKLDNVLGENSLDKIIQRAKLKDRQKTMIKHMTTKVDELVVNKGDDN